MTRLFDIMDELRETQGELARLEDIVASHPQYESLRIDIMSVQKLQRRLEEEFRSLTNEKQIDVVNYRLITAEQERVPILALTSALESFQWAISTIFDALKNGPKKRGRVSADSMQQSEFDFAYAGSGSIAVVLSIPNDRLMFGETLIDRSVDAFFSATQAETRDQILEFAHEAGIPSVRRLYEWSGALAAHGVSADIQWRRQDQIRSRLSVEGPRLKRLREIIEEASETESERVELVGLLVGLDVDLKTFHIKVPNADDIVGTWSDEFQYDARYILQSRYTVRLIKKSKTYYAYEREEISWELTGLAE
jgi:hypothetical protein